MPYSSLAQANPAIRGIKPPVSLGQANLIAEWADKIKKDDVKSPWAVAIAQFKKLYRVEGNRWVKKEKANVTDTVQTNLPHGEGGYLAQGSEYNGTERKCPKCGEKVKASAKKCPECGATLKKKSLELRAVKMLDEDRIGGYLAMWGTKEQPDLVGEYFTPETDFWLGTWKTLPLLFHHGFDESLTGKKSIVGEIDTFESDDIGLWVEAQLKKRHEYREAIGTLIGEKALGLSSGAFPKPGFIVVEPDGFIKSWAIVEGSLTTVPMEPRMADVEFLKACDIDLNAIENKEGRSMSTENEEAKGLWHRLGELLGWNKQEEPEIEETETVEPEPIDTKAIVESITAGLNEAVEKSLSALQESANEFQAEVKAQLGESAKSVKTQLDEMVGRLDDFEGRLEGTEKSIEEKVAEKMSSLPPIVKAPVTEIMTEGDAEAHKAGEEKEYSEYYEQFLKTFADAAAKAMRGGGSVESF